jgi:DNA-binding NarL/FixJ family response regulator
MDTGVSLSTDTITIAIVEDEAIAREGFATLLAMQDDFDVIASVADFSEPSLLDADADVILMDARLIARQGADLASILAELARRARIIATRVSLDHQSLGDLVRFGVSAFVFKDASFADLVSTIRAAASAPRAAPEHLVERKRRGADATAFDMLTAREREIALLIACGKNNREIAEDRSISPHTVSAHVRNIMEKLAVHSRLHIAVQANRERWTLWDAKRPAGPSLTGTLPAADGQFVRPLGAGARHAEWPFPIASAVRQRSGPGARC